ncbi:MAG: branched-chain amino acid ABC transporter permease [Chloroflexi bacterium]|nr:branched-chain amino acid ABC transporter permease [Chloroflexota bacterium]
MEAVLQYTANGLMVGGVYALIALGIVLVYKSTSVFNFAIGQMMMFGAFFFWMSMEQFGLPVWISLVVSLVGSIALGLLIERFTLRPLIGQPLLSAVLVTLALVYFLNGVAMGIWGAYQHRLPEFLPGAPVSIGGIVFSHDLLWSFFLAMALFVLLFLFYQRTRMGLAMRATAESHQVAQARGINVRTIFSMSWALCGVVAAVGGMLLGYRLGVSQFLALIGLKAFPAVLFGGLDSIGGALIGGLTVGVLENLAGGLVATWMMEITPYIILLVVLIIRPEGLFGLKRIERI